MDQLKDIAFHLNFLPWMRKECGNEIVRVLGLDKGHVHGAYYGGFIVKPAAAQHSSPLDPWVVQTFLAEATEGFVYTGLSARGEIIFIYASSSEHSKVRENLENSFDRLQHATGSYLSVCIGCRVESWDRLSDSFWSAQYAVQEQQNDHHALIVWANDAIMADWPLLYNTAMEKDIASLVFSKKSTELQRVFGRLYQANFVSNRLTYHAQQILFSRMYAALKDTAKEASKPDAVPEGLMNHNAKLFFEALFQAYHRLMDDKQLKAMQRKQYIEGIVRYIDRNFHNCNLSLNSLSQEFAMPTSTLSQLLRKQLGCNFTNYRENLRKKRAEQLIASQKWSVDEIATMVGYNSTRSFRRAFKRNLELKE